MLCRWCSGSLGSLGLGVVAWLPSGSHLIGITHSQNGGMLDKLNVCRQILEFCTQSKGCKLKLINFVYFEWEVNFLLSNIKGEFSKVQSVIFQFINWMRALK